MMFLTHGQPVTNFGVPPSVPDGMDLRATHPRVLCMT